MTQPIPHIQGKIFIVEDEFVIAQDLRRILTDLGYAVMGMAKSADEALEKIAKEDADLVLLDINIIGDKNGIDLAKIIKKRFGIPYIFVTSYSDTGTLKEMNATNPSGYILKPFDQRDIRVAVEMAFAKMNQNIVSEDNPKRKSQAPLEKGPIILGDSPPLKAALKKVAQVSCTNVTVLLNGETGTGKELFMQAIHQASPRNTKPLVKINCAALPNELIESVLFGHEKGSFTGASEKRIGKFELADNGTIFLDEIGELPLSSQAKLLRCLQEKEIETVGGQQTKKIDVRIIAATNRDLAEEVEKGTFRADLYFRLNIFPIRIPPLRERMEDIIPLANHFLELTAAQMNKSVQTISKQTVKSFCNYGWPGNVRELQHCIERGVILAEGEELSVDVGQCSKQEKNAVQNEFELKSLEEMEREQIIHTLQYCNGKVRGKGGAAEILKLHPNTLDFRIKKLGITKTKDYKVM
ncbi:sigma-54-dependent transcriptional regulator [Spongiimicrobium salis]|uniref:sigma-54-dependent transcriptional regulator n=1 Tax=Spongiimicrobium salis TaxID=1667022 RepID=UPI00374D8854